MTETTESKKSELLRFAERQLKEVILPFWSGDMVDEMHGGFVSQVDHYGRKQSDQPKGIILNARILWAFSAVFNAFKDPRYLELADRAFHYLQENFLDSEHPGYVWSIHPDGTFHNDKKQIYAQAFVMYALAEYTNITGDEQVLNTAFRLFDLIEEKSFDRMKNGYLEAFSRNWKEIGDLRLSELDMNEKKTMNTHLHIIEAYTRLYSLQPEPRLKDKIQNLIHVFQHHIMQEDHHLGLFFDEDWDLKSDDISFGHDIEASWLLHESALCVGDDNLIEGVSALSVNIAKAVLPAITTKGGLIHEGNRRTSHISGELEWWAQAEAVVAFINVFKLTHDNIWLDRAMGSSRYIDRYFTDHVNGEWYYRVDEKGNPIPTYEKAGFWKCPYHNTRMCLEVMKRLG